MLEQDTAPDEPFVLDADDAGPTETQLEADLLLGKNWPFFRDTSLDDPANADDAGDAGVDIGDGEDLPDEYGRR